MSESPIKVGGPYVENEDHVPNSTDMVAQYNTSGLGASDKIDEITPVFQVDRINVAQEILAAFDDDDDSVPSDRVLLPNQETDNEVVIERAKKSAQARIDKGVEIGGLTPAQEEAAKEGDEANEVNENTGVPGGGEPNPPGSEPGGESSSSTESSSESSSTADLGKDDSSGDSPQATTASTGRKNTRRP